MSVTEIQIASESRNQLIDITKEVQKIVSRSNCDNGICYLYVPHTTAAVTINESADYTVREDILNKLGKLIPYKDNYKHIEGNSDAHIKSSMFGNSCMVFIENGKLLLGTWQGIYYCEFDGPRSRRLYIKITV